MIKSQNTESTRPFTGNKNSINPKQSDIQDLEIKQLKNNMITKIFKPWL